MHKCLFPADAVFFNFLTYSFRFSSTEDRDTFTQEIDLCVISCLDILKAISSKCNFKALRDCLHSIETWVSVLGRSAVLEEEKKRMSDKIKQTVVESLEVVKRWLKKNLISSKFPWYSPTETEKELEVINNYIFNESTIELSRQHF